MKMVVSILLAMVLAFSAGSANATGGGENHDQDAVIVNVTSYSWTDSNGDEWIALEYEWSDGSTTWSEPQHPNYI